MNTQYLIEKNENLIRVLDTLIDNGKFLSKICSDLEEKDWYDTRNACLQKAKEGLATANRRLMDGNLIDALKIMKVADFHVQLAKEYEGWV